MYLLIDSISTRLLDRNLPYIGGFCNPAGGSPGDRYAERGIPWAMDNAAFSNFNRAKYERMIKHNQPLAGWSFVTVPDAVGNARLTHKLYQCWHERLCELHCIPKLAYVMQDGMTVLPWDIYYGLEVRTLFIGGSTEYKLSADTARLVRIARSMGLDVHMGRVNSLQRMTYAYRIGCTTVDGSGFSRWPKRVPLASSWLQALHNQLPLEV